VQLAGRDEELGTIEAAVAVAAAGGRRTIGIFGEAGIGKSALLEAAADAAGSAGLQALAAEAGAAQAVALEEVAVRELRRAGSRVSARARRVAAASAGDGGETLATLTPREREVAELVAEGGSNKEVAAALFLSEKTIEHHLSRIYAKLEVRSRVELARRIG